MNTTHSEAIQTFAFRLKLLLTLRVLVRVVTFWFFFWGVVVLALRIANVQHTGWLALGVFGFAPLVLLAIWRQRRHHPELSSLRANYDRLNACGGILMSEEAADMSAWHGQLPGVAIPKFHWRSGRPLALLGLAAAFTAIALLLPERLTRFGKDHSLEIGQVVQQLQAEVKTLAQEKILDQKKAQELKQQLSQVQKDASGYDPSKTWEALDHVKQANTEAAKEAAEEAINKTASLAQAETLAGAMAHAADSGMSPATAAQAAQELASLLDDAKLKSGILSGTIPPDLLSNLDGLNHKQLEKLMKALEANKKSLGHKVSNLASLKLIDAATLAKCLKAGQCHNMAALTAYLCSCTNGCSGNSLCRIMGRGGPGRGGPPALMTWDNNTSEKDLKFQAHALPPTAQLSDARLVGISKSAPELSGKGVVAGHGALDNATAGGGSAHSRVILPEQRQVVQNFFKRDN